MSLIPAKWKFTIWRGATFRKRLTLLEGDVNSDPQDLTDYTAVLEVLDTPGGDTLLTLDTNDGILLGGPSGTIEILIDAADTEALLWTQGHYDLLITAPNGGDTDAILYGTFVVKQA